MRDHAGRLALSPGTATRRRTVWVDPPYRRRSLPPPNHALLIPRRRPFSSEIGKRFRDLEISPGRPSESPGRAPGRGRRGDAPLVTRAQSVARYPRSFHFRSRLMSSTQAHVNVSNLFRRLSSIYDVYSLYMFYPRASLASARSRISCMRVCPAVFFVRKNFLTVRTGAVFAISIAEI